MIITQNKVLTQNRVTFNYNHLLVCFVGLLKARAEAATRGEDTAELESIIYYILLTQA